MLDAARGIAIMVVAVLGMGCQPRRAVPLPDGGTAPAPTDGGGAAGSDAGTSGAPHPIAWLTAEEVGPGGARARRRAFGSFAFGTQRDVTGSCSERRAGACVLSTCPLGGTTPVDAGVPVTPRYLTAGEVEVRGTHGCTLPINAGMYGVCQLAEGERFWDAASGGTVVFSATGGEFPAFRIERQGIRGIVTSLPLETTVSRSSDWTIRWTGGSGPVELLLDTRSTSDYLRIVCTADASAGSVTVPATLLGEMVPSRVPLNLSQRADQTTMQGDAEIQTTLFFYPDSTWVTLE